MSKRNERKKSSARRRIELKYGKKSKPAKASNYLHHLKTYYKKHPDIEAIICCRVSACIQERSGNLDTQEKVLRKILKKHNIPIVECYREVSSGWILDEDRGALVKAVKETKKHRGKKNIVIVATSSDRFLRNEYFTTKNPDILPTVAEFEELKKLTCDVPLATLLHPDMSPKKARGYQSKWGQKVKGNKGGRPKKNKPGYKKQRRIKKLYRVLRFHNKGMSFGKIATLTGIPKPTVWYWVKKYSDKIV
ncbi:MAG: recombinase family protein [Phycisphaerales bacterium]|jgi:DNA invertase Pin-like site-specific DNA recombinase